MLQIIGHPTLNVLFNIVAEVIRSVTQRQYKGGAETEPTLRTTMDQIRADQLCREVDFNVRRADGLFKAFIKSSLAQHLNEKLALCFYGPFEVVEVVGVVPYHLWHCHQKNLSYFCPTQVLHTGMPNQQQSHFFRS